MVYLYSGKSTLKIKLHHLVPDVKIMKEILTVGTAPFARHVAGSIVAIVLNHSLKFYGGDLEITILGLINRITMFLYMPLFGLAQGLQPIVGFNYGAKKSDRVKEAIKLSIKISTIAACVGFVIAQAIPGSIMAIFNSDTALIENGSTVLRIVTAMLPFIGLQIVGSTVFQSIGKALPAFILSLSRQVLFFIPLAILLPRFMGLIGIWISFPISDFLSAALTGILLKKEMNHIDTTLNHIPTNTIK